MAPGPDNPWIRRTSGRRPRPEAALRLVCFPYAGGGASIFRTWPDALPADVELLAIELPGHESRTREALCDQIGPLVTELTDAVAPVLQTPFAIFGHSLGATLGFAFARELRRRSLPGPAHLFVSGRRAPQLREPQPLHHLPEPEFLAGLRRLGGTPDAVLAHAELMAMYLPILRADFTLAEASQLADEAPLACPISALGGVTDARATVDELDAWRVQTAAGFDRTLFPGGHFFLQTERDDLLAWLSRRLAQITAAR